MVVHSPTNKQIEDAKAYLLKRLAVEQSAEAKLVGLLHEAALKIYTAAKKYNVKPSELEKNTNKRLKYEIRDIINALESEIELLTRDYIMKTPAEDDKESVIAWWGRDINGKNYSERLKTHIGGWEKQIIAVGAAAIAANIATEKFLNFMGKENISEEGRLTTLTRYSISDSWMYAYVGKAEMFYSMRGSSYPCSLCDSMEGPHHVSDFNGPWHPRCCCIFIPMY